MPWVRAVPYVVGLAVLAIVVVVDLVPGTGFMIAYLGLAPLIMSAWVTPAATLAFGGAATATAVAAGAWEGRFGTAQHMAAVLLVVIQAGVGLVAAKARQRRESELLHVRAVADVAQRALLPAVPAAVDGVGFATRYLSAARDASVGGDFYEVVRTPHTTRVIIGDVKGKGLPAVRLAAVVLGAFREAAATWLEPEQVAAACARAVGREADTEDFVTALLVDIHASGRLSLCSAGHHLPVLLRASGSANTLRTPKPSPPLGIAEQFTAAHTRWDVADRLLLFTDGLVEARDAAGGFFPLEANLAGLGGLSLDEALGELTLRVTAHAGGNLHDDMALVLAERRPLPDEAAPAGPPAAASTPAMA
jgi:serine phosphatase RsbU (regulator of sigma subunit)